MHVYNFVLGKEDCLLHKTNHPNKKQTNKQPGSLFPICAHQKSSNHYFFLRSKDLLHLFLLNLKTNNSLDSSFTGNVGGWIQRTKSSRCQETYSEDDGG